MKTSAVAVRSVLRDGLEHPSGYQTARVGLATFTAVKLYRDGLEGRYKQQRIKELEREVRELRKTNEILKLASAYFAQAELDRHHKK